MLRKPGEHEEGIITAYFGGSHIMEKDIYISNDKQLAGNAVNGFIIVMQKTGSYFCFNPKEDDWEIIDHLMFQNRNFDNDA